MFRINPPHHAPTARQLLRPLFNNNSNSGPNPLLLDCGPVFNRVQLHLGALWLNKGELGQHCLPPPPPACTNTLCARRSRSHKNQPKKL